MQKIQIIEAENRLLKAMKNGDIDILDELLHDKLLFVVPGGQTITKQMDLEGIKSGNMKIHSITTSDQQISIIDDNAIVSVVINLKANYLGQEMDEDLKYIRIWKEFETGLKVVGGGGMVVN